MLQIIIVTEHSLITSEFDNNTLDYFENTLNWCKQFTDANISIAVSQSHYQQIVERIRLLDQLSELGSESSEDVIETTVFQNPPNPSNDYDQKIHYFVQPEFRGTAATIIGISSFFEESDHLLILPILPNFPKDFNKYLEIATPWVNNGDLIVFGSSINPLLHSKGSLKTGKLLEPGEIAEYALDNINCDKDQNCSDLLSWQNTGIYFFQKLILSSEVYKYCPEIGNLCQQAVIFGEKEDSTFRFGPKYESIVPKSWEEAILKFTQTGTVVTLTNWVHL